MNELGPRAPSQPATDGDKAYAAGFFDGEGNICLHRHNSAGKNRRYRTYHLGAGVGQIDVAPLLWLRDRWGGSIRFVEKHKSQHYTWYCATRMAAVFLADVLPYLKVKRARAELALQFQAEVYQPGRAGRTPERLQRMEDFKAQMAALNARGEGRGEMKASEDLFA